jgi:hypothetical protein
MLGWSDLDTEACMTLARTLREIADRLAPRRVLPPLPAGETLPPITADDVRLIAKRLRWLSINRFVDNVATNLDRVAEIIDRG